MSTKGPHVQDSVEAEVLACRRAPEFAIDIGFFELMIEGDNAQVLNSILSSDKPISARPCHCRHSIPCS